MNSYDTLAIPDADNLLFGNAPTPVTTPHGLVIGGGTVYPELNFTLPTMALSEATYDEVKRHYRQIAEEAVKRAAALEIPGLVLEFETLPPMTENPAWGEELSRILLDTLEEARATKGVQSALRVTPNDIREMERPPRLRSGRHWDAMLETFERCAAAGADMLSIESVGGKEVHDEALTMCNLSHAVFALCVMGARDMTFLWQHIVATAKRHAVVPAGDTACGFGNTAMVLAEQGMIPRVFAAVIRAVSAVRSLAAYACGAVGPGKDCGYENVILKAITGAPMAMEGKTASCAHFSPVGNIAAAACDLWSNESVQNIRLLAGMAPTCFLETLAYDCRLFNATLDDGPEAAKQLRGWLVKSDALCDPQAYILAPEQAVRIAQSIVQAPSYYAAGRDAGLCAVALLREGMAQHELHIEDREQPWLDRMQQELETLPDDEDVFVNQCLGELDHTRFIAAEYDLA